MGGGDNYCYVANKTQIAGEVCDDGNTENGDGCTATCQLNTAPQNTVPGAQSTAEDVTLEFSVAEGNAISVVDIDGDILTVTLTGTLGTITLPAVSGLSFSVRNGVADATMTFSGTAADITDALDGLLLTPNANVNGAGALAISTSDGAADDEDVVAVTITGANDDPSAGDDAATILEDGGATTVDVLANDSIAPDVGETLAIALVGVPDNGGGTTEIVGTTIRFTPTANFNGTASFAYTITDGNGGTAGATVTVTAVNDPPTVRDDSASVDEDCGPIVINVLANDSGDPDVGETLSVTAVSQPLVGGSVTLEGGVVTFTPAPNFNGDATFTVTVSDGNGGTAIITVTVRVAALNDALARVRSCGRGCSASEEGVAGVVASGLVVDEAPAVVGEVDDRGASRSPLGPIDQHKATDDRVGVVERGHRRSRVERDGSAGGGGAIEGPGLVGGVDEGPGLGLGGHKTAAGVVGLDGVERAGLAHQQRGEVG